ncbi:MAG: hypothetical protein ABH828_02720 [archaeon]
MNRKGAFSILVNIIFIVIGILVAWSIFMPILGALFNNPQASTAYDNFQTLTLKIEKLLDDKSVVKTDVMFFDMGQDYNVKSWNTIEIKNMDEKKIFSKEQKGKAVLCFFKKEEDANYAPIKAVNCKAFEGDIKFYTYYTTEPGFVRTLNTKLEYPSNEKLKDIKYEYSELHFSANPSFRHELYIEVVKDTDGVKHVLVGKASSYDLQARYKYVNTCPEIKDNKNINYDCNGKHFDEVVRTDDKSYYCSFDEEENACIKKESIEKCGSRQISKSTVEVCDCGETAFSNGFCIDNKFYPRDLANCPTVSECGDYKNPQNCVFSTCRGPKSDLKCNWDASFMGIDWLQSDHCGICTEGCECDDYEKDWQKIVDPCNCDNNPDESIPDSDGGCFDKNEECKNIENCDDYKDESTCNLDQCELRTEKILTSTYEKTYCKWTDSCVKVTSTGLINP